MNDITQPTIGGDAFRGRSFGRRSRGVIYLHEAFPTTRADGDLRSVSDVTNARQELCGQIARTLDLDIVARYLDWTPAEQQLRSDLEQAIDRVCLDGLECLIVYSLADLQGGQQDPIQIGWDLGNANVALIVAEQEAPELAARIHAL